MPLGYTRDEQGIIVDPSSAALVRRMFLMRGQPSSLGDIAASLNAVAARSSADCMVCALPSIALRIISKKCPCALI